MDMAIQTLLTTALWITTGAAALWAAGAVYFDVGRAGRWSMWLVLLWLTGVACLFVFLRPAESAFSVFWGVFAAFLVWWLSQRPSNQRAWDPASAVLAKVATDGDRITIENVRNTHFNEDGSSRLHYETRTLRLSRLCGVDLLLFYWGSPWMSHPILVFNFGEDGRVCISIEVRYRAGQEYNVVRSLYRQQEIIYVVADERDVVLRRTKQDEGFDAYLYQLQADVDEIRTMFQDYLDVIKSLNDNPRWYHGLCANCTTSVYRQRHSRMPCDWRVIINGRLDRSLYDRGRLDRSRAFETLKRESQINEIANRAPWETFGDYIRRELEKLRSG